MPAGKLTILLSGMLAAVPFQGGATWAVLQYLLGLRRLGHEVYFVEQMDARSLAPSGATLEASDNAAYFRRVASDFNLRETSALLLRGSRETTGLGYDDLLRAAARADVLLNLAGTLDDEGLMNRIPARVYLDLDPAFTQLWHAVEGIDMRLAGHTHFVTVGLDIGRPSCPVPTCGVEWLTTLQPVVLEEWPAAGSFTRDALTTVANWRGYGSVEHEGVFYGQKAHAWREFFQLPTLTREQFAPALSIHPGDAKDLNALLENNWRLLDPASVAPTPGDYRRFVAESKAEFGVAKSGYVHSRCGWFSDRSACYLASGRPVVAQETGFSKHLPTGEGLFSFRNIGDALRCIEELNSDYERHARAARRLAEQFFDSDKVLPRLLSLSGVTSA
ncbi:MAG TPA: hypothetical protein VGV38_23875 [Pyrinomonadaceae bacterium]|nr:hypothetical protein [Pyrinomonadaceae bacterium]